MPRVALKTEETQAQTPSTSYFTSDKAHLQMIPSGCALLDCVLGGGWPLGRIANIAGDRSSGKTLLGIEAAANFVHKYPKGLIRYVEAEAAFDLQYAAALGMPVDHVSFGTDIVTVEEVFQDIDRQIKKLNDEKRPGLYIIDSLDALSDKAEQERGIDDGSYGAAKAKKLSEMFRRQIRAIEQSQMAVIIISQIRDKIGVTFGETQGRSGGKALDFYASQILWLAETGKIRKTIKGQERVTGINVKARVKKNKVGLAFRECEFPILFGYGMDDVPACIEWLSKLPGFDFSKYGLNERTWKTQVGKMRDEGNDAFYELRKTLKKDLKSEWAALEQQFMPKTKKY